MSSVKNLYAPERDKETIDKMVTDYLPLVRYIVGRLPCKSTPFMDEDDLTGVGILGLINAAKTYDPAQGASFKTYAYTHIKGAILDELRRHDSVPRSMRDRIKKVDETTARLMEEKGRIPTPEEIAQEAGISIKALDDLFLSVRNAFLVSLDDSTIGANEVGKSLAQTLASDGDSDPHLMAEKSEMLELLINAIQRLPESERQVVFLYYNQNLLLKEIGAVLKVSESRACQILSRAHYLLNKEIKHMGE
jgi:RNA polymerase sigma factor for flagellar operon FliA